MANAQPKIKPLLLKKAQIYDIQLCVVDTLHASQSDTRAECHVTTKPVTPCRTWQCRGFQSRDLYPSWNHILSRQQASSPASCRWATSLPVPFTAMHFTREDIQRPLCQMWWNSYCQKWSTPSIVATNTISITIICIDFSI